MSAATASGLATEAIGRVRVASSIFEMLRVPQTRPCVPVPFRKQFC
jgi:hypothetical protein